MNKAESNARSSLALTSLSTSADSSEKQKNKGKTYAPKSSQERRGWRKWHRKCTQCPEDMQMKWRDQRIKWICGAYQRARRTFKSLCMMHFRNCQDGTMFTKVADHRCENSTEISNHGLHFFYDYKVFLSDESRSNSKSESISESSSQKSSSESWDSDRIAMMDQSMAKAENIVTTKH